MSNLTQLNARGGRGGNAGGDGFGGGGGGGGGRIVVLFTSAGIFCQNGATLSVAFGEAGINRSIVANADGQNGEVNMATDELVGNCVDICPGGDDTADADGDGVPDFCDTCSFDAEDDEDGDGLCNSDDNCPTTPNADQSDFDADGIGNVCDTDIDGDNVQDILDACVPTELGTTVNAEGCSIAQLCPCENSWKNHGAYVSCVAHATGDFVNAGLFTEAEKDVIVSEAGQSACGHKKQKAKN